MTKWTVNEIAEVVNGTVHHASDKERLIEGIDFDTRRLTKGNLFVPLVADRNGHDFVSDAIEKGASAALWSDPIEKAPEGFPIIQVDDTLQAFQTFAKWYLDKINPKVVGITGSNGKTTTKDMTEAVLSTKYRTHKTQGNFNNQIGMPITILEMPEETEVIILEMGMDHAGEIHKLSALAEPDVAVITMIGESHIEFLGSREAIADAKVEISDGLKHDGLLIYSIDEPLLVERVNGIKTIQTFGTSSEADLYAVHVDSEVRKTRFSVNQEPDLEITLPTPGVYNVQNALAALLVGLQLGISLEEGAEGLGAFQLTKNRLEWLNGLNGSQLLNDAYNASPSSMKAVLDYFSSIELDGNKIVVLGDILELGEHSKELHRSISDVINPEVIDELILYGEEIEVLYQEVKTRFKPESIRHFSGAKTAMIDYLRKLIQPNDTVLIKSSLGTDLLQVVSELTEKDH